MIMKASLDAKDRKILYELDINSRQASSKIAKKVGLSKQVVNFRIKRLIKEKLISFFYTVIDISKLGFAVHKIFLRLQNIDSEILFLWGKNSRTTAVEIAKMVKLSGDAIAGRIKRLEKSGVIRHYNIVPNESKFPYLHYKVLIGFRNISEEREKILREYSRTNSNIVYIVKSLGQWEFEIDLEVESAEHFREIMMDLKKTFSDILKDYSALHIYQIHKYNFCPSVDKDVVAKS